MGLLDLIWNIHQDSRIRDVERRAGETRQPLRSPGPESERMALVMRAMWELLVERIGVTEDDLIRKVEEIDRRDGVVDGRLGQTTIACPNCKRVNIRNRELCLYCNSPLPVGSALDRL